MRRLVAAVVCLAVTTPARAQPSAPSARDVKEAERLFAQGRGLLDAGRAAEACPYFEESQALDPGRGTLINLAACYEAVGRLRDALRVFRDVAAQATAAADEPRLAAARRRIADIEARIPHLAIEGAEPGVTITVNGEAVTAPDVVVDPGRVAIVARAPGRRPFETAVDVVADGRTTTVTIPPLAVMTDEPEPVTIVRRQRTRTFAGLGIAGAGTLALGGSIVLALQAKSSYDDALEAECGGDPHACSPAGKAATDDARARGNLATIVGGVGLLAIAGGLALWLTAPEERVRAARVVPQASPDGVGVALVGRF